jgi:hypothetical protein
MGSDSYEVTKIGWSLNTFYQISLEKIHPFAAE